MPHLSATQTARASDLRGDRAREGSSQFPLPLPLVTGNTFSAASVLLLRQRESRRAGYTLELAAPQIGLLRGEGGAGLARGDRARAAGSRPRGGHAGFLGFSTFYARPLINVHDLMVSPDQRGRGVGRDLLQAVDAKARALGCCKVTLEVFENNHRARRLYAAAGFAQASYTAESGGALFLARPL